MGGYAEIDAAAIAGYEYNYSWSPSIGLNNTTVAVSYTHLDVYKRQLFMPCMYFIH